jgi:hypothetical protein
VYEGQNSLVFHAIDRRTGISMALKLYKREKLTEIERYQVRCDRDAMVILELRWASCASTAVCALVLLPAGSVSGVRQRARTAALAVSCLLGPAARY